MSDLGREQIATLQRVLGAGPALRLAVVFGSTARGERHPDSDLDIGIIPDDASLSLGEELELQVRLEQVYGAPVDLVRLDRAPVALRWRAARDGIPILGGDSGQWARFAGVAASEHADIEPALRRAARRFQQRLVSPERQ